MGVLVDNDCRVVTAGDVVVVGVDTATLVEEAVRAVRIDGGVWEGGGICNILSLSFLLSSFNFLISSL